MEENKELIIDLEFAGQIPPLDPDEYQNLEANILEEGKLLSPIVTWNGIIVDGHNRYKIIQEHPERNIQYKVCEKDFPDRYAVLTWICKNQMGQRNLTPAQKKVLIGEQYKAEKQSHNGAPSGNQNASKQCPQNEDIELTQRTAERIAKEYGVGHATVERAGRYVDGIDLAEKTVPGIRQEILSGKIRPTDKEMAKLLNTEDAEERKKLIEDFYCDKKEKRQEPDYEELIDLPKDEIEEPVTQTTIKEVEEISAGMESSDGQADEDGVIYELNDALDTLIFRWQTCVEINSKAAKGPSYRRRRNAIVKKGLSFMHDFTKRRTDENKK